MKKLFALNILLIVSLFYTGIHLNENGQNFAAGYYPGDNYEWAGTFYTAWAIFCTIFAVYVAYRAISVSWITGWTMLLLSVSVMIYALFVLIGSDTLPMQEVLPVFGIYIIWGMWQNIFMLLKGTSEFKNAETP